MALKPSPEARSLFPEGFALSLTPQEAAEAAHAAREAAQALSQEWQAKYGSEPLRPW